MENNINDNIVRDAILSALGLTLLFILFVSWANNYSNKAQVREQKIINQFNKGIPIYCISTEHSLVIDKTFVLDKETHKFIKGDISFSACNCSLTSIERKGD